MKILLTHPFCWPYLRRGTERNIENLFNYLAATGRHDVTLLSTKPAHSETLAGDLGSKRLRDARWTAELGLGRVQPEHVFGVTAYWDMRTIEADAVHSFFYTDGLAASNLKHRKHWRTVLQLNGIAIPGVSCRRIPPEAWLLRKAIETADEFVVCSSFIADQAARHFGRRARVLAPPIQIREWPVGKQDRSGPPVILAVGDFDVRRKGIRVLLKAFEQFHSLHPGAVLNISGRLTLSSIQPVLDAMSAASRQAVRPLGLGKPGDLPALYQSANVLVLPAMWEPSGTVMFEALACGTPVVAARHGGLPEFLSPEVGVLFDPQTEGEETMNATGLCEAIESGLQLSYRPGIREACREHAQRYSTESIGPVWEQIYGG